MGRRLMTIAERALDFIEPGSVVGLGSGRAATRFLHALAARFQAGFRVHGIATSEQTAELARELGIPLTDLDHVAQVDVTVDGADEVSPQLDLIKGRGGALVREKIVAAASRRLVILVGPEKLVSVLGTRGLLPVEVVPFAVSFCARRLRDLALVPATRLAGDWPFTTDNGNYIIDCGVAPIENPAELDRAIRAIPGVVGTGLFIAMADVVLIGDGDRVELRERQGDRGMR